MLLNLVSLDFCCRFSLSCSPSHTAKKFFVYLPLFCLSGDNNINKINNKIKRLTRGAYRVHSAPLGKQVVFGTTKQSAPLCQLTII